MAHISLYNLEGKAAGSLELSDAVFAVPVKNSVVHQVYTALMANLRRPWADTKDRGEVSGGGKKPWKQKGTGRARHGSIRSPIWKGGGVTFGPLSARNYKQKINKKMNQAALRMCLSDRLGSEQFLAVETLPTDGKTKAVAKLRSALPGSGKTTLLVVSGKDESAERAVRNIPRIELVRAQDVNVLDVLNHQYIIATKDALVSLEKRLTKKRSAA
jgi:large subunit ribosomal protein L4